MKKMTALLFSGIFFISLIITGCAFGSSTEEHTGDTGVTQSDLISSEEEVKHVEAGQAVKISVDGEEIAPVFLLSYNWYGEEYTSEDTLTKIMMDHYAPEGQYASPVWGGKELIISFDAVEGVPSEMKLTQYANTVRANSGLPFDVVEEEPLIVNENTFSVVVNYRTYRMFYYLLECAWSNGNTAKYAFAVEKPR